MFNILIICFFLANGVIGSREIIGIFPKIPNTVEYGNNELCKTQSKLYEDSLKNYTFWALQSKVFDSSAKFSSGVLQGNSMELGNYEECLGLAGPFPTQHCIITVNMHVPAASSTQNYPQKLDTLVFRKFRKPYLGRDQTRLGLCLPASCSVLDIENNLNEYLKKTETLFSNDGITYTVSIIKENMCTNKLHPNEFGALQIIFCILCTFLVVLVLAVTTIDYKTEQKRKNSSGCSITKQILFSFSAIRTWEGLFNSKENQNELGIFHGVRSICQFFIIFGHLYYIPFLVSWVEMESIEKYRKSHMIYFFSQLTLLLHVFFLMCGLLLSYGTLTKLKDSNVNPITLIVLRYFRLTPVNAFVIFYFVAMLGFSGSGPAWKLLTKPEVDSCLKNWWTNILYVNNFVISIYDTCNRVTWFISVDFQLFIMGVLVMFIISKNKKTGYAILIILLILSVLPPFLITSAYKYSTTLLAIQIEDMENYFNIYYVQPYAYATTYIIGLLGGIMFDRFSSQKVAISKKLSYLISGVSILFMVIAYGYPILLNDDKENYIFEYALYNALYKQLWTIGTLGTFVVASFGPNNYLRPFLSSRIWIPFSKLSYGVYLVHWGVLFINYGISSDLLKVTPFNIASQFISVTTISLAVAFILYFLLEMPLENLAKIIFFTQGSKISIRKNENIHKPVEF